MSEEWKLTTVRSVVGFRSMRSYLDKRCRPHLKPTNDSWRVDETVNLGEGGGQILVSGSRFGWKHPGLFTNSARGMHSSAKRFFHKTLQATHAQEPLWINVDKNADEPKAIERMKAEEGLPESIKVLQNKYLNNRVEQDHRFIKRLTRTRDGISLI